MAARRGVGGAKAKQDFPGAAEQSSVPRPVTMSGARWLKRVFGIEINTCARCGGPLLNPDSCDHRMLL